jgi:hypothetical protein
MGKRRRSDNKLHESFVAEAQRLEDLVQRGGDLSVLGDLLQLYAVRPMQEAISYFESIGDDVYLSYHQKTVQLLKKTSAAKKVYTMSYEELTQEPLEVTVESVLMDCQTSLNSSVQAIKADIEGQVKRLQQRLQQRSQRGVDRGSPRTACSESDGVVGSIGDIEGYLQELELHTERYIEKKLAALQMIEFKYAQVLSDDKAADRLRDLAALKSEELETTTAEIEQEHRDSMSQLKSRYLEA